MQKQINILLLFIVINANAQPLVTNDGLVLTIQSGLTATIKGAFTNQTNGASLGTIDNAGIITFSGDWTNNSANTVFSTNSGLVQIIGTAATQTIGGTNSTSFYDLTTNNTFTASPQIVLAVNTTVKNTLTMTQGNINLAGFTKTLGTSATTPGTLSHGLIAANGWMYGGNFARYFNAVTIANGSVTGLFPVGTNTNSFRPFYVSAPTTAPTSGGLITLSHTNATTVANLSFADGASTVVRRHDAFWTSTASAGLAGGTYNLRGEGSGFGTIGAITDLRLTRINDVVGTAGVNAGTTTNPQVNRVNLTLSELSNNFYIGSINGLNSPLPIQLIDFSATCIPNGVALNWATATEFNNDYFLIERSNNGIIWEQVAKAKGLTNSVITTKYAQVDYVSYDKLIYYRMTQVDVGGKSTIFKIIDVNCGGNSTKDQMILFPNPASSEVNMVFKVKNNLGNHKISLVNITGQIIFENTIDLTNGTNSFAFPIDVPAGSYTVLFTSDKMVIPAQKLMVIKL